MAYLTCPNALQDLRFLGKARHGIYRDDCAGVHPDTIAKYYGTTPNHPKRPSGATGAGHPEDERDPGDSGNVAENIADDQESQVKHDAVEVPLSNSPFDSSEDQSLFFRTLATVVKENVVPVGYGMTEEEWDDDGYPDVEFIKTRRRGGKELRISLESPIWKQRAILWVQALSVLAHFTSEQ